MAKQRHRIFEIYEHRDEAIQALTPKSVKPNQVRPSDPLPANFNHLTVSASSVLMHVQFKGTMEFPEEAARELRDDFSRLAGLLEIDSKVLVDFSDVKSFSPGCVDALVVFVRTLRNRGSRAVLCSIAPNALASFYAAR